MDDEAKPSDSYREVSKLYARLANDPHRTASIEYTFTHTDGIVYTISLNGEDSCGTVYNMFCGQVCNLSTGGTRAVAGPAFNIFGALHDIIDYFDKYIPMDGVSKTELTDDDKDIVKKGSCLSGVITQR